MTIFYTTKKNKFATIRRDAKEVVALTSFGGSLYGPSVVYIYAMSL